MTKVGYLTPKKLSNCTDNIIKEDVILPAGESVDIDVRVWLDSSIPNSQIGNSFYAKLSIDGLAVYNDNEEEINNDVLSLVYMKKSLTDDFKNDTYKTKLKKASFVDYIDTTNASINTETSQKIMWDISVKQDNSVIAWLEPNNEENYYDLYIGCDQKIYAKNFESFFNAMTSLISINFDNLDTSLTTAMNYMFYNCSSLTELDLSNFDTRNVTKMQLMFFDCNRLTTTITVKNANVTDYEDMFSGTSTTSGTITVNYTSETSTLVDNMIATKSSTSNVVKGSLVA